MALDSLCNWLSKMGQTVMVTIERLEKRKNRTYSDFVPTTVPTAPLPNVS